MWDVGILVSATLTWKVWTGNNLLHQMIYLQTYLLSFTDCNRIKATGDGLITMHMFNVIACLLYNNYNKQIQGKQTNLLNGPWSLGKKTLDFFLKTNVFSL